MPPIARHKTLYFSQSADCRALFNHCLNPKGPHTDSGVEAAFLQVFKAWESLLEECTLSYMAGRLRCDGAVVNCHVTSVGEESARRVLYQEKSFIEWTDTQRILTRWEALFASPSRLEAAVNPIIVELRQMAWIRNAIAHSSPISIEKYLKVLQSAFGGLPKRSRPGVFLASPRPAQPNQTFFDWYVDLLDTSAQLLTG